MNINGLNVGYFTAETTKRGCTVSFEFTTSNHPALRKPVTGIRVPAVTPDHPLFKTKITVPPEKEEEIRRLIIEHTKVLIEFRGGVFVDIYDIVPRNILVNV
jgi:hypothetical protein